MNQNVSSLEPTLVWEIFGEISKVPRQSKKEEKIRDWVKKWSEYNEIEWKEDSVGNLLLIKEATKDYEKLPGVVLQAHLDMVAQKTPESNHNFDRDPISLVINEENGFVTAKNTTLGADNGIGMAMCLAALIDPTINHGPIEVLLTVDEETGLTGAFALEKGFFIHKYVLNLDSEDEGEITISSAGGGDSKLTLPITRRKNSRAIGYSIRITGLSGGHSGIDINKPRINAIKLMNEALMLINNEIDIKLIAIEGGSARNAIPREANASFLIHPEQEETLIKLWAEFQTKATLYRKKEPKLKVSLQKLSKSSEFIIQSQSILKIIDLIPHGPLRMSKDVPDLVETSNNLAIVQTLEDSVVIQTSTRSSVDSALEETRKKIQNIGKQFGVTVDQGEAYPGWEPQLNSPFLKLIHQEYERYYSKKVKLKAIHAGLECGLLKGLDPDLQIVSMGPEIKDGHSPNERVYIKSVGLIWEIVKSSLSKLDQIEIER